MHCRNLPGPGREAPCGLADRDADDLGTSTTPCLSFPILRHRDQDQKCRGELGRNSATEKL